MKSIFAIVGMKHRGTVEFVAGLPRGEPLTLVRESNNPFDSNAVQVWARDRHAGFIRGTQCRELARFMDGRGLAQMTAALAITSDRWPMAEVDMNPAIIKEGRNV